MLPNSPLSASDSQPWVPITTARGLKLGSCPDPIINSNVNLDGAQALAVLSLSTGTNY